MAKHGQYHIDGLGPLRGTCPASARSGRHRLASAHALAAVLIRKHFTIPFLRLTPSVGPELAAVSLLTALPSVNLVKKPQRIVLTSSSALFGKLATFFLSFDFLLSFCLFFFHFLFSSVFLHCLKNKSFRGRCVLCL